MVWFKVDDKMGGHPKVLCIPRKQRATVMGVWMLGGIWCAGQMTNGALPTYMLGELGGTRTTATILVSVGLWEETDDGWQYHDWEQYQPTREQVENERAAARERMANRRNGSRGVRPNTDESSGEVPESSEDVRDPRPDPTRTKVLAEPSEPRKRGSRINDEWMPSESVRTALAAEYPHVNQVDQRQRFIDYWISKPGKDGVKTDWDRTWRNWIKTTADRTPARIAAGAQKQWFER